MVAAVLVAVATAETVLAVALVAALAGIDLLVVRVEVAKAAPDSVVAALAAVGRAEAATATTGPSETVLVETVPAESYRMSADIAHAAVLAVAVADVAAVDAGQAPSSVRVESTFLRLLAGG